MGKPQTSQDTVLNNQLKKIREILPHNDGIFSLNKDYKSIKWLKPSLNPKMKRILMSKMPYQSKITSTFFFKLNATRNQMSRDFC